MPEQNIFLLIYAPHHQLLWHFYQTGAKAVWLPQIRSLCLIFGPKYSISHWLSYCQMGLAKTMYWISHNMTQDICRHFSSAPEPWLYPSKYWGCAFNQQAVVSYPVPAIQYWPYSCHPKMDIGNLQWLSCRKVMHITGWEFSHLPDIGWIMHYVFSWLWNAYVVSGFLCNSIWKWINYWKTITAPFQNLTAGSCHGLGQWEPCNVAC